RWARSSAVSTKNGMSPQLAYRLHASRRRTRRVAAGLDFASTSAAERDRPPRPWRAVRPRFAYSPLYASLVSLFAAAIPGGVRTGGPGIGVLGDGVRVRRRGRRVRGGRTLPTGRRQSPEDGRFVFSTRKSVHAIFEEAHGGYRVLVARQFVSLSSALQLREPNHLVFSAGKDPSSIGRHRHAVDRPLMSVKSDQS